MTVFVIYLEKIFYHEEHEEHEEWNIVNYPRKLLDMQVRSTAFSVLEGIHKAQLLIYMELTSVYKEFLIDFNVKNYVKGLNVL